MYCSSSSQVIGHAIKILPNKTAPSRDCIRIFFPFAKLGGSVACWLEFNNPGLDHLDSAFNHSHMRNVIKCVLLYRYQQAFKWLVESMHLHIHTVHLFNSCILNCSLILFGYSGYRYSNSGYKMRELKIMNYKIFQCWKIIVFILKYLLSIRSSNTLLIMKPLLWNKHDK